MAELVEMPFGLWSWMGPRTHVLGGVHTGTYLVNTTDPSMCDGDAAFLLNYF